MPMEANMPARAAMFGSPHPPVAPAAMFPNSPPIIALPAEFLFWNKTEQLNVEFCLVKFYVGMSHRSQLENASSERNRKKFRP